ncbi:A-kinase anchor protein 12 isoform X2 [Amblyraja radiata]|uniref:A-kinase anchor protein 12 isoform X2 n=1 Tax=Amblyraja radiata TaxID=386614 RepID=UPI001403E3F3|nr:A-kinase anchor protein 12 isoform X2 [Amblyraja radiata]
MGAGTSVQESAGPSPPDSPGQEEEEMVKSQREASEQRPAEGVDGGKSVQNNGQISGMQGESEVQEAPDKKSEQLNGIQEEVPSREVGQGDPAVVSEGEEMEEMELNQEEVPIKSESGEPINAQEGGDLQEDTGEQAEDVQAAEIGFKKVFKFVGLKFTMKKEKPVKSEPVQLLTVTREENGRAGETGGESQQAVDGGTEANGSPIDEAEGSPPEILSPEIVEEKVVQEETKPPDAEEPPAAVETSGNAAETPAVDSPLKRFFKQGFFSGLRRKQSFKKAKDEPLIIGEKTEANGEQAVAAEAGGSGETERGPEAQPSTSQEAAEVLAVPAPEENRGGEEEFEDLTSELACVRVASEPPTMAESKTSETNEVGVPTENLVATDTGTGQVISSIGKSTEGAVIAESAAPKAATELQAQHEEMAQEKPSEPIAAESELLSSQSSKQQDSPLRKLFTSSSIKKLSGKKAKGKKGEARARDTDDETKLQSSTESEGSPDGQKPDSPPTFLEETGEGIAAETTESGLLHAEQEDANGGADGERRKEPITAWASFKKLVTPRKRPKGPSESDRDDEQNDKVKSATISSAESTGSEKQEEPKSNGEEQKLERSVEDPKKKADAPVTWEALICVGSSKKRTRKLSESELQKSNEEAQSPEGNGQAQDSTEEAKVSSPQATDQEQGEASPECVESPVEGEAPEGAISTWESFKRLVTSRRKSKSKLEERVEESVPCPEAALPEAEAAKDESWVSLKKLIPGRKKKRSDAKPEQLQGESVGKEAAWAEFGGSKSEDESETPAVVPLTEYAAVDDEREHEERLRAGLEAVQKVDGVITTSDAAQTGELGGEPTVAGEHGSLEGIKSSVDERSPSWISVVSDVIKEVVEDQVAEEAPEAKKQTEDGHKPMSVEEAGDIAPDEVAEEAQVVLAKGAAAVDHPADESFTEEMVSAVSQLTETPVTTAEGTPVQEDEAVVSRQTQEVLEEAAEKVKLVGSCYQTACKASTQGAESEPEIPTGKIPCEQEPLAAQTLAAECAQKAAEQISGPAMTGAPAPGDVRDGPGEVIVPVVQQGTEAESSAPAAVVQEVETLAAQAAARPVAEVEEMLSVIHTNAVTHESTTTTTMSKGVAVRTEIVEIVLVQTSGTGHGVDVEEPEVAGVQSVTTDVSPPQVEKTGAEQVVESGETEVIPDPVTRDEEAATEQVGDVTPGDAEQEGIGKVEVVENAPEMGAEKILGEGSEDAGVQEVQQVQEQSAEAPAKVEEGVIETVFVEETRQIVEPVDMRAVEISEEHIEVTPSSVTGVLHGEETNQITAVEGSETKSCAEPLETISAVGVTERVCGEETTELAPVGVTEALLGEEPIVNAPAVGVTEVRSNEETTELTPVGVAEAQLGEEPIEITPAIGVTDVMFTEVNKTSPDEAAEGVCSEETTEITLVGVTEMIVGDELADISQRVTQVGYSEETSEITTAVVSEALPCEEPVKIFPAVRMMEAVCSEKPIELPPVGATKIVSGEEPAEITQVSAAEVLSEKTIKVTSADPSEVLDGEEKMDIAPVGVTKVCAEETTEVTPVVGVDVACSEMAQSAPVEVSVEQRKSDLEEGGEDKASQEGASERNEEEVQQVIISEVVQEQFVAVEILQQTVEVQQDQRVVAEKLETRMEEAVCEGLAEEQRAQEPPADVMGSAPQILLPTSIEGPCKETNKSAIIKVASVDVTSETVCDVLEGVKSVQPKVEETLLPSEEMDTGLVEVSRVCCETPPREKPEELLVEMATTETATKQVETEVTSEPLNMINGGESRSPEQATGGVESKLPSQGKDKPAQGELQSPEKMQFTADDLIQSDMLSVIVPNVQNMAASILLKNTESSVKPQTKVEYSHATVKLITETICPTVESAPKVTLHAAITDECRLIQNETVTAMEDLPIDNSSESCEETFMVTALSVKEGVITETLTTTAAEIPEQCVVDRGVLLSEDVNQTSIAVTAAVLVESAIEMASGYVSGSADGSEMGSTLDGQMVKSFVKEQLEHQPADCKIKENVAQISECLEAQNEGEASQALATEQLNMQTAQAFSQDALVVQMQGQESTKKKEDLPGPQKDLAIEGTCEVVDHILQTSGSKGIEGEGKVVMQSVEVVSETTVRGDQVPIETETLISVQTKQAKELSDGTSDNISVSIDVIKPESCFSLEEHERIFHATEVVERIKLETTQQIAEEQTLLNENLAAIEVETMVLIEGKETGQNQTPGTNEKKTQEVEAKPAASEFVKDAAEKTPS